jgi:hypothetical protein
MSKQDHNRADARFNKPGQAKAGKSEQDVAAKAVLDNMARLKALRLAREAADRDKPPEPKVKIKKSTKKKKAT